MSQNAVDEGCEAIERDWDAREVAWQQFRKEYVALCNDYYRQIMDAPKDERTAVRARLTADMEVWWDANHVPRPEPRPYNGPPPVDTVVHNGRVIELFADRQPR